MRSFSLLECHVTGTTEIYPVVYYAMGYFHTCKEMRVKHWNIISGQKKKIIHIVSQNRIEEVLILQDALRLNIHGAKAAYSLGKLSGMLTVSMIMPLLVGNILLP